MYGFKTLYLHYSLFNGDWHEQNDNFGDAIFVMGYFSILFCVRAHDLVNSIIIIIIIIIIITLFKCQGLLALSH